MFTLLLLLFYTTLDGSKEFKHLRRGSNLVLKIQTSEKRIGDIPTRISLIIFRDLV